MVHSGHEAWCGKPVKSEQDGLGYSRLDGNRYCTTHCEPVPASQLTAQAFLAILPNLPPNVRRFRAGDFEVELDGPPPPAAKVPTAEQAAAQREAEKPRPPSDIDSLGMTPPAMYVEDEAPA